MKMQRGTVGNNHNNKGTWSQANWKESHKGQTETMTTKKGITPRTALILSQSIQYDVTLLSSCHSGDQNLILSTFHFENHPDSCRLCVGRLNLILMAFIFQSF